MSTSSVRLLIVFSFFSLFNDDFSPSFERDPLLFDYYDISAILGLGVNLTPGLRPLLAG